MLAEPAVPGLGLVSLPEEQAATESKATEARSNVLFMMSDLETYRDQWNAERQRKSGPNLPEASVVRGGGCCRIAPSEMLDAFGEPAGQLGSLLGGVFQEAANRLLGYCKLSGCAQGPPAPARSTTRDNASPAGSTT